MVFSSFYKNSILLSVVYYYYSNLYKFNGVWNFSRIIDVDSSVHYFIDLSILPKVSFTLRFKNLVFFYRNSSKVKSNCMTDYLLYLLLKILQFSKWSFAKNSIVSVCD